MCAPRSIWKPSHGNWGDLARGRFRGRILHLRAVAERLALSLRG
jgi:hypothetical protein